MCTVCEQILREEIFSEINQMAILKPQNAWEHTVQREIRWKVFTVLISAGATSNLRFITHFNVDELRSTFGIQNSAEIPGSRAPALKLSYSKNRNPKEDWTGKNHAAIWSFDRASEASGRPPLAPPLNSPLPAIKWWVSRGVGQSYGHAKSRKK